MSPRLFGVEPRTSHRRRRIPGLERGFEAMSTAIRHSCPLKRAAIGSSCSSLTNLACAGDTCYASGNAGTLLKSGDGGATWTGVVTGVQQDLPLVRIIGGKADSVVTGGGCVLRRSDDGGKTFTRLPFTARDSGPASVAAVVFPSSSVGYLVLQNGAVLSTADGGRTFSRKTAVPGGTVNDLLCTSSTTCFAVTAGGTIQRSTDAARSWTRVGPSAGAQLRGIVAAGPTTMYAGGDGLTLLKSIDKGATWTSKPISGVPGGDINAVCCTGAATCLLATRSGSQILRTTDGGDTFASVVPSSDPTLAADFDSATRAVAVGATGSAEISDDGGANWRAVGARIEGEFHVLHAVSGSVAYAGGAQGVLASTANSGQSWANISPPTSADILAIAAPSGDTIFVLAPDGSLQRSDNGGASYKILNTGAATLPSAVVALDAQRILLLGPRGVRRSANGGDEFEAVADKVARAALVRSAERVGNSVFAYGSHTLIVSRNGGASWKKIVTPRKRTIRNVSFGTPGVGFLLDTRGRLWRTANGGKTWRDLKTLGGWAVESLEFADAKHGFALAGENLLRTDDGGNSWHPQHLLGGRVAALQASEGTAFALVGASILYATTTGGDVGEPQRLSLTKRLALKKPGTITLKGKLNPADGREDVMVSRLSGGRWSVQHATVASNGAFSTRWRVSKTSVFVAQIFGDADHAGAGTSSLTIKVVH
jgi:photosystem II stability/assembly factor-like uncharacterized protein